MIQGGFAKPGKKGVKVGYNAGPGSEPGPHPHQDLTNQETPPVAFRTKLRGAEISFSVSSESSCNTSSPVHFL